MLNKDNLVELVGAFAYPFRAGLGFNSELGVFIFNEN